MVVLAIDTSHALGAVALGDEDGVRGSLRFGESRSHLVELGRCVDRLLGDQKLGIDRIDRIALVEGPGSFTGLRVGLAFAKGLYAGLDLDVVVMNTLKLLALPHLGDRPYVCPMMDARKREVYAAVYRAHDAAAVVEPTVRTPEAVLDDVARFSPFFVGSGAVCYRTLIAEAFGEGSIASDEATSPSVDYLCRMAPRLRPLSEHEVCSLEPFYIRSSDAELKRLKSIDPDA